MPTTIHTTDLDAAYQLSANEDYILVEGVRITSGGNGLNAGQAGPGHNIAIYGDIYAGSTALSLLRNVASTTHEIEVLVGPGANIVAISNQALITNADRLSVTNFGNMSSLGYDIRPALELYANTWLVNAGTIAATAGIGVFVASTVFAPTVAGDFDNSGLITGGLDGVAYSNRPLVGLNSGEIRGARNGVVVTASDGSDHFLRFTNAGLIRGGTAAVLGGTQDDVLRNSGTIEGLVDLGTGADAYVATRTGTVLGDVLGGGGADTLIGGDEADRLFGGSHHDRMRGGGGDDSLYGGSQDDVVSGGADADSIEGGAGFDTLYGDAGDDTIYGGGVSAGSADDADAIYGGAGSDQLHGGLGDDLVQGGGDDDGLWGDDGADTLLGSGGEDRLDGGAGTDVLRGGDGDDILIGGTEADVLYGNAGDDDLYGGSGDDVLSGGDGANRLFGGLGRDRLGGGADADSFVWLSAAESTPDANRDIVSGFTRGTDLIDLAALVPGVLAFSGTGGLAGIAGGEVAISENAAGNSVIQIDLDADRRADMQILVSLVTGLTEADFVL